MKINKKIYLNTAEVHEMIAQTIGVSIDKFKVQNIIRVAVGAPGHFNLEIEIETLESYPEN